MSYHLDEEILRPCCKEWAKAHEWGTDNEGYGPLIYNGDGEHGTIGGRAYVGPWGDLEPVCFCPWCGADKGALT